METGSGNASGSSADSAAKTTTSSGDGNNRQGCGCVGATKITVRVTPTTGGQFDLSIAKSETIENLKKLISKKLKVPKERICLLHRDRQLRDGTLQENQLMEGSRLTLLPSVETGLLAQRPEQSVMQALESLNDSQVNDFLSGKAPLNLTMRLGDHMMLIQLQLSTVTPSSSRRSTSSSSSSSSSSSTSSSTTSSSTTSDSFSAASNTTPTAATTSSSLLASRNHLASSLSDVITGMAKNFTSQSSSSSTSSFKDVRTSAVKISSVSSKRSSSGKVTLSSPSSSPSSDSTKVTTSPSDIDSTTKTGYLFYPKIGGSTTTSSSDDAYKTTTDPKLVFASSFCPESSPSPSTSPEVTPPPRSADNMNKVTSVGFKFPSTPPVTSILKPLSSFYSTSISSNSHHQQNSSASSTSSSSLDSSKSKKSVSFAPSPLKSLENATKKIEVGVGSGGKTMKMTTTTPSPATTASESSSTSSDKSDTESSGGVGDSEKVASSAATSTTTTPSAATTTTATACKCDPAVKPVLDTRALAEASRNLTQTLKQLSSEVLTSRADPAEDTARARRQGAIIESMHHHGKGVYSGTFSGTLNPALQDRYGRPKRDISTIIHILNDLLCATPQYRRHAATAVEVLPKVGSQPEVMDFPEDSLLRENQATRGKLEQLRLIMEERRARRRARREARSAPYTTQWSAKSETLNSQSAGEPMDTGDSSDLCEMTPPEPVVA